MKDNYNKKVNLLNERLKNAKSYEDIKEIKKIIENDKEYLLNFIMKRSEKVAFNFRPKHNNKVSYLLDDRVSKRESKIKNLHRNIIIK